MTVRLIPPTTPTTQPYWDGAAQGELKLQVCATCGHRPFPPHANCERCGATDLNWQKASGKGTVYTYTVSYRPPHPLFREQCPMVIAVVELAEGPRLITNIVECDPETVTVGMAVEVVFEPIDESDVVLPVFKPAKA